MKLAQTMDTARPKKKHTPYVFGARGVSTTINVRLDQERDFFVDCTLYYRRKEGEELAFQYKITKIAPNVHRAVEAYFTSRNRAIFIPLIDSKVVTDIEGMCSRSTESHNTAWRHSRKLKDGEKSYTDYDPKSRNHFNRVLKIFTDQAKELESEFISDIKRDLEKSWEATVTEVGKVFDRMTEKTVNNEVRSKQMKINGVYKDHKKVLQNVFGELYSWCDASGIPYTEVHAGKNLCLPPFMGDPIPSGASAGGATTFTDGRMSFLITFGVEPYPFAVVLVVDQAKLGSGYISSDPQLWSIIKMNDKYSVYKLEIPYTLGDEKLELGALVAMGLAASE